MIIIRFSTQRNNIIRNQFSTKLHWICNLLKKKMTPDITISIRLLKKITLHFIIWSNVIVISVIIIFFFFKLKYLYFKLSFPNTIHQIYEHFHEHRIVIYQPYCFLIFSGYHFNDLMHLHPQCYFKDVQMYI